MKARVSEAIRLAELPHYDAKFVAVVTLRQIADQIENSAISEELDRLEDGRPRWTTSL